MRFCFIIEDKYRGQVMPMAVADELVRERHAVDVLEAGNHFTCLFDLAGSAGWPSYDAYVLKTAPGGPGLTILESAGALGLVTVNDWRSIRRVRDKAVASAVARRHGLPFPTSYYIAGAEVLDRVPADLLPVVVKPSGGCSGENVYKAHTPDEIGDIARCLQGQGGLLVQQYVKNPQYDLKLYNTGSGIYAIRRSSPLHPNVEVTAELVSLPGQLRDLVLRVGEVFNLDVYGVDVVASPDGWVVIDVNDFPSFGLVPNAARAIARTIVRRAEASRFQTLANQGGTNERFASRVSGRGRPRKSGHGGPRRPAAPAASRRCAGYVGRAA